jgi:hypothetical protein
VQTTSICEITIFKKNTDGKKGGYRLARQRKKFSAATSGRNNLKESTNWLVSGCQAYGWLKSCHIFQASMS